MQVKIEV